MGYSGLKAVCGVDKSKNTPCGSRVIKVSGKTLFSRVKGQSYLKVQEFRKTKGWAYITGSQV